MSKLVNCKDCGKEVSKNAKTCPNCGAKVKKGGVFLKIVLGLFLFFVFIGIIANLDDNESSSSTQTSSKKSFTTQNTKVEKKSDLELLDWKITTGEYGNTTITGRVKNNKSRELSYAQIQFNLYDASGAQVGTAMANVNNLEPNGIWKFEAVCLEDNFKTAKFKELTGF